jgi:hypothetical protein
MRASDECYSGGCDDIGDDASTDFAFKVERILR